MHVAFPEFHLSGVRNPFYTRCVTEITFFLFISLNYVLRLCIVTHARMAVIYLFISPPHRIPSVASLAFVNVNIYYLLILIAVF